MAGKVGAAIIDIILLAVSIMFLTGLTLSRLGMSIAKPLKRMSEDTNERLERGAQRVKEEQERAPSRDARRKKAEEPYVSPRPFPVPPLPTDEPAAPAKSRKKADDEGPEPTVFPRKPRSGRCQYR